MELKPDCAAWKWLALGAAVIVLETMPHETLSASFTRGLESRYRPYVIGALAVTAAHLMDALPHTIDPYFQLGKTKGILYGYAREN